MPRSDFYAPVDRKVRPQDDFYRFATNAWVKRNPIPADQASWAAYHKQQDEVLQQLRDLLEKLARRRNLDPESRKLVAYWRVAMDEELAEKLGADPLVEELARIDAADNRKELPELIARLHNLGAGPFWDYAVAPDIKRNDRHIVELFQSGTCLPERDYYLKTDARSKKIRAEYLKAIARLMRLAGWSRQDAEAAAQTVLALETRLAKASMSSVELRDFQSQYNKMSPAALGKKAKLDWKDYLAAVGVPAAHMRQVIVCQPAFMAECAAILNRAPLEDIKTYLSWHLVESSAPYLSEDFVQASFAFFGKVLSGRKRMRPRWKRAVSELDDMVGFLLGKHYVKEHFPEEAKRRVDALVDDLFAAYRARMSSLPWMSVKTMTKAIEKLDVMRRKIGYPAKWRSYAAFRPDESSFLAMNWAAMRYVVDRGLKKLGKPVDRSEWGMTPQTVNAYCDFVFNEIAFPAAFLQRPHFDKDWIDALNYGAIGSVIGHELTHAFDDQGAQFDKDGNLRNWWAKQDKERFDAEAQRFVKQYGKYVVVDRMKCNGKLTLGENIADVGGIAIAYDALERRVGKQRMHRKQGAYTPAQLFFISYAQTYAGSFRAEEMRRRLQTDPHAPPALRVNAALPNLAEFHEAFGIRPGDKLYRKPADRVQIW